MHALVDRPPVSHSHIGYLDDPIDRYPHDLARRVSYINSNVATNKNEQNRIISSRGRIREGSEYNLVLEQLINVLVA